MQEITKKLKKLPKEIESNLKCSIASIHKIKHDEDYNLFIKSNTELKGIEYIVYSNFNQIKESILLDKDGSLIKLEKNLHPKLSFESLDFNINNYNIIENHPFASSLNGKNVDDLFR
jgi:hypothetical protein